MPGEKAAGAGRQDAHRDNPVAEGASGVGALPDDAQYEAPARRAERPQQQRRQNHADQK